MNQDMVRKQKKYRRTWISFAVILFLLLLVFFSAINTGSLSVSFGQLLRGLFVEYDENVAAVYDLRFPRILISMLAGAAIAVSGVLFQAVLKNPLADPGIIGISSGAGFAAVCVSTFFPTLYFFTPFAAFFGGVAAFFLVYCLSWKQGLSPLRIILTGVAVDALFTGLSSIFSTMTGGQMSRCGIDRRSKYHAEDLVRCRNVISLCTGRTVSGDSVCRGMQSAVSGRQNGKRTWNQCKPHQDCDLPDGSFTCQRFNRSCRCRKLFGTDRPAYRQTAGWK